MIKKTNKTSGQAALILILLTAAALIFLAIILNWGRIAQTKALLTVAVEQSASLLASDAASYGEMQKQYLDFKNQKIGRTGLIVAVVEFVVAVVIAVIAVLAAIHSGGASLSLFDVAAAIIAVAAAGMSAVNLALQIAVVQPGITATWNKLEKSQPVVQQFYEGGIAAALQGSVTDRVNVTDYFDSNANGILGSTNNVPNDTISRFALFYTDRLKMLNQPVIPQVAFFYNQLGELMNGETCDQNESDYASYPFIPLNPACAALGPQYCINNPLDPVCQVKIPNVFQLNDACSGSNPFNTATYSPYCDPCCQPLNVPDPFYSATTPNPLHPTQYVSARPSNCDQGTSYNGAPAQCLINNPYGAPYTLLYDPAFQDYASGTSFLAQYGRDQPMGTPLFTLTPDVITPSGVTPIVEFPNGVFPFFWLMGAYSPQVDNINPSILKPSQIHWCAAGGAIPLLAAPPAGFSDLAQLSLPYSCHGSDCCVNYIGNTADGAIDMVGASNPALSPSFGEDSSGSWLQGDNQMCSTTWPYNGANSNFPDGTCEWTGSTTSPTSNTLVEPPSTLDGLDYAMHTLSEFVNFSNIFLSNDVGTLSATFSTWYPQAADWIDPSTGRLPSLVAHFSTWNTVITNWLNNNYASPSVWCVPPEATLLAEAGNGTTEETYIQSNSSGGPWGGLSSVIACLNYNSTPATVTATVSNYNACLAALVGEIGACSALPAKCAPSVLGRSLAGPAPAFIPSSSYTNISDTCPTDGTATGCTTTTTSSSSTSSTGTTTTVITTTACSSSSIGACTNTTTTTTFQSASCNPAVAGSVANWAQNSATLATNEAPKFALRSAFLTDVQTKATTMPKLFQAGYQALSAFLAPCSGVDCSTGGPAAQLTYAYNNQSSSKLPNSVIYGWVDNTYLNGQPGYAHIVKVTAYSPGRNGNNVQPPLTASIASKLPWIKTTTALGCGHSWFDDVLWVAGIGWISCDLIRTYTLTDRDGFVYVSVKRWDENHSNSILFPNGHTLWQTLFQNPTASNVAKTTGQGLMQACNGLVVTGGGGGSLGIGFGLVPQTAAGLGYARILPQDQTALANAFMLNDNVNGKVDPNSSTGPYASCLSMANKLLANAPESHICAEYIASRNASGSSGNGDSDYSLKFVSCPQQTEDMTYNVGNLS